MKNAGQKLYIFAKFPQRNSIQNQIETFWMKNEGKISYIFENFLNEIRIRIKLQLSEWKRQVRNSFKLSSTKFHLESNWNILKEKRRPEFPISLQNFLNEIRFGIKLKHSEWKTRARISYIFAKFPQRNSI